MLLKVEKELEEEYVTHFFNMQNLIINIWQIMMNIRSHYIQSIGT